MYNECMHYAVMVIFQIICGLGMSIVQLEMKTGYRWIQANVYTSLIYIE